MPVIPGSVALTDGTTGPPAIKPASTAAIATDLALVVAISPNNTIPTNITQISGAAITEGQKLMAASVPVVIASDQSAVPISGSVTTLSLADTVGTPATLNALNALATVALAGHMGAGVVIAAGTLAATLLPVLSFDGGITYTVSRFYDPFSDTRSISQVLTNPNPASILNILVTGGATHAGVLVSPYTSGSTTAICRATLAQLTPTVQGGSGTNAQAWWTQIGDSVNGPAAVKAASILPVVTDPALVVTLRDAAFGNKTNNNAAPGATNLGVLPAIATAAAPIYVEGNQVGLSTDLAGNIRITGSISASSTATATENNPSYTEGDITAAFSQDLEGNLRTRIAALVSDARESYITGEIKSLSLTSDGRLRVSTSSSDTNLDFFGGFNLYGNANDFGISSDNPYQQSFPLGRG
jgi:hypothetical protein